MSVRRLADGRLRLSFDAGGPTIESDWDAVVLAIPFSTLREVVLDPSLDLPPEKRLAIDQLVYGTNSKMMIGFDGRPWFTPHSDGSSFSDLPNHQNTWETNPARATTISAILTDYSGGLRGASLDPGSVSVEALLFLVDLETVYPGAGDFVPREPGGGSLRVHLENWSRNPLFRGSYTCNQPGYLTTIAGNEAPPVGNPFFAGEHTSSFYEQQGFMEGAVLSGQLRPARCTGSCADDCASTEGRPRRRRPGMLGVIDRPHAGGEGWRHTRRRITRSSGFAAWPGGAARPS